MRQPNVAEIRRLSELAHATARVELAVQRAQQALSAAVMLQNEALMEVAEACHVPPGQPLDLGRRCWIEAPLQQGMRVLEPSGDGGEEAPTS